MDNKQATLELGTKPIGKLLWQYSVPAIIAMLASSLYNMVDSIFIGQGVGPMAISGLAVTFPFMNLTSAFGAAIGIGSSTLISLKLGQKDYATAERVLSNMMAMTLIMGVGLSVICLVLLDPILLFFGASPATLPYARDYMEVIMAGNVITHFFLTMNAVLRAASKPRQAMTATIITVLLNTILDPIFIYPWGLNMGIRGAALATILAQVIVLCYQFRLLTRPDDLMSIRRSGVGLQWDIVRNVVAIGVSPFAMNVSMCFVVIIINNQLVRYGGDMAVGAYGIVNRIAFVFVMIVIGLNQGMQPIAAYNYGARLYDRLHRALRYTIIGATTVMTAGWLLAMLLPYYCARLFTSDKDLIDLSIHGIRYLMMAYPIVGFQMVTTFFFQCIGKTHISIFLSLSRQIIFLIPLLFIFPLHWGVDGVWAAIPSADALASAITATMLVMHNRHIKQLKAKNAI